MAKKQPKTAPDGAPQTKRRKSLTANISPDDRVALYAAAHHLPVSLERAVGLQIPFTTYMQDPAVAKDNPALAFDEKLLVDWEPGLADGPTSAASPSSTTTPTPMSSRLPRNGMRSSRSSSPAVR